ncbi:MAG: FkbM family methyltransferase [Actinomycetales bacterium]
MPGEFVSYAQNGEDVVLRRALRDVDHGCYVEVGGNDPTELSVSRAFYDAGWQGVVVEPVTAYARRFRAERPRDTVVEAAVTSTPGPVTLHQIDDTGLSTLSGDVAEHQQRSGWDVHDVEVAGRRLDEVLDEHLPPGRDVHFLVVDVEGAEADVLASLDLARHRPWVLVVEATQPLSDQPSHAAWEPGVLAAGYRFTLFDGLSRFYVHEDHAERARALSYPACALDEYIRWPEVKLVESRGKVAGALEAAEGELARLRTELESARADVATWRARAVEGWTTAQVEAPRAGLSVSEAALRRELDAMQQTLSWRITRPLRAVRKLQRTPGGGR